MSAMDLSEVQDFSVSSKMKSGGQQNVFGMQMSAVQGGGGGGGGGNGKGSKLDSMLSRLMKKNNVVSWFRREFVYQRIKINLSSVSLSPFSQSPWKKRRRARRARNASWTRS